MSAIETTELAPGYRIPRIVRGGWQLAGGHGAVDRERAITEIGAFVAAGLNTVDGADIYTGVEALYGEFNARRRATESTADGTAAGTSGGTSVDISERTSGGAPLQVHTKCVPDFDDLPRVDAAYIRRIVIRSLQRLNVQQLDLVQFHWWDYAVPGWIEAAQALAGLQREGLIAHLGATNFDTAHTLAMLDAGVPLVAMQSQYSLLDRRADNGFTAMGAQRGVQLLCYGTLAGGFFSERWLGAPEPLTEPLTEPILEAGTQPGAEAGALLTNRSLIKYKLVINDFGGWAAFQQLLQALKAIADKHGVRIATVATRWVLDRPGVAAAIVGARYADHLADTLAVFTLKLDAQDHALLAPILAAHPGIEGDTYTAERDKNGRHGRIMKYNLNKT